MIDPLTGLLNRRAFLQDAQVLLQQQIARDCPIGVLLVDLDHFKSINDRFGHTVGDKVLQIFAKTTQAKRVAGSTTHSEANEYGATPPTPDPSPPRATRAGGGERTARGARAAQRLRGRIEDQALHATASIGVSVIVDPAQDLAKLITLADQALYLAKARGRNRVEVAPLEVSLGSEAPQAAHGLRQLSRRHARRRPHRMRQRR